MLLEEVASASARVAAVPGRLAKVSELAACLRSAAATGDERVVRVVVSYLSGELPQRRTGIGWATLRSAPTGTAAGTAPQLTVEEVDEAFGRAERLAGAGSQSARVTLVHDLLSRATPDEARLLGGLVSGELRQGAQAGVLLDAVVKGSGAPAAAVRRATTLSGSVAEVAVAALLQGPDALAGFTLQVGRGLSPMLAKPGSDVATEVQQLAPAAVEWKLDGIRIQVHRDGDDIRVFTRTLDEVSARLPEVAALALALPVTSVVLDAEAIALHPDGRPRPFQETASRVA